MCVVIIVKSLTPCHCRNIKFGRYYVRILVTGVTESLLGGGGGARGWGWGGQTFVWVGQEDGIAMDGFCPHHIYCAQMGVGQWGAMV